MHASFDTVGSIAILPQNLKRNEAKIIAKKLLEQHKSILTVLHKSGRVKGRLRKPELTFMAGKRTFETIHKESNCMIKVNLKECFFSPRLSNDRLDIARQVKKGEKILVMFSGVAPLPLVIAKNSKPSVIYAVELNKAATKYAKENIKLNKLDNIIIIQGDAKKAIQNFKKKKIKFDRIVMPRPQLKEDFLKEAFSVAKKGAIINFHDFLQEREINQSIANILKKAKQSKRKVKILRWKKAGDIGPYKYRIRIDFVVL